MERYDIAIIGTGPAGLEAAVTAKIRNKKLILFGNKNLSIKVEKAHTIQNYLGLPNISGEELKAAYERHLKELDIEITEDKISAVYAMGKYFALQGNGVNYEATTVILATGVSTAKPYPGEEEFLGRGVSYCATCDGMLYRGKKAIVWGLTQDAVLEANFLAKIGVEVQYISMRDKEELLDENIVHIKGQVSKITGKGNVRYVVVDKKRIPVDAIFILRDSIAPDKLMAELRTESGYIEVNRKMETNVPGLYAAGDCIGKPLQIAKAVSDGLIAAQEAARYLDKKEKTKK